MEMNDFKTVLQELASDCRSKDMQGICILTKKDTEGMGVSALACGDTVEITMAIMRAMASDSKIRAMFKIAVENYNIFKESTENSIIEKVFKDFNRN